MQNNYNKTMLNRFDTLKNIFLVLLFAFLRLVLAFLFVVSILPHLKHVPQPSMVLVWH